MHRVVEDIIESNRWRDGEFAQFKINRAGVEETLWCRMCIPMIYAHWEGFVVSSLKILIKHLNVLELTPHQIQTYLIVMGLGDQYNSLSGKQSFAQRVVFKNSFKELMQNNIKFSKKVETKSNLKSNVLKELCEMFGFEFERFKNQVGDIDRLIHIRNSIAHGENSINPDFENLTKYITSVNEAMDIFRN